jgi:multidrug resistance efflux pump
MNANELADFLDMYFSCNQPASNALCDAANMLRILDGQLAFRIDAVTKYQAKVEEQQAEIEALKKQCAMYEVFISNRRMETMNHKPVAWIFGAHLDSAKKMPHLCRVTPTQENENYIPLYNHPANPYQSITNTKIEPTIVSYTHPV